MIATAQSASETNISFVVAIDSLRKALNVIHDSFFLSEYQVLNLFICGIGTVGGSLIEQLRAQQEKLATERNLKLHVVGIANGHKAYFSPITGVTCRSPEVGHVTPREGFLG